MSAYAELAVSTNFSFLRGASHGEELVARAKELGFAGLGVTDRNSVAGVVRAHQAAKEAGLTFAPGARLIFADGTPDILAYPQDRAAWGRLTRLLTIGKRRAGKGECLLQRDDLVAHSTGLNLIVMPGRAPLHLSPAERGRIASWRDPGEGEPLGELRSYEAPSPGMATDAAIPASPRRGEVKGTARQASAADPDQNLIGLLRHLGQAAPGALWLGAGMQYRGDDGRRLARLAAIASAAGVPLIAVGDALYHTPERRPLQDVMTCIRTHLTLAVAGRRLEANAERHLKAPGEMARLFRAAPQAVAQTLRFLDRCRFSLDELRYEYPDETRAGFATPQAALVAHTEAGARTRYPHGIPAKVRAALDHEFALIAELEYAPYFLTVHDIVRFARSKDILCQGRGSAANSAVCFCLGITEVDPDRADLLFERFVSAERREPPDIDVDFEHERREDVIQYIYERYGRHRAGLAATVICYRSRSAIREVGKVFGLSDDTVGALAGMLWGWSDKGVTETDARRAGLDPADPQLARVLALARELIGFPRHLSQHVGGFVITRGRLDEVVPIENAAMAERTCVEWDKDDLDALGILKIDVLALGMLSCLRRGFDLLNRHYAVTNSSGVTHSSPSPRLRGEGRGEGWPQAQTCGEIPFGEGCGEAPVSFSLAAISSHAALLPPSSGEGRAGETSRVEPVEAAPTLPSPVKDGGGIKPFSLAAIPPEEPAVYRMLSRADSIGVFQVESRAQMSMLPRLQPKTFYDLVIEVAIVRPGPIQGDMVHPYLRRRQKLEEVRYPSPAPAFGDADELEKVLGKTLGVPLFQEQAMRIAIVAAGFTPSEADKLRRAMATFRRVGTIKYFRGKLIEGMASRGYPRDFAERCFRQIEGFGEYGFPESHAASFALLVYASAWMKCRYPDVFAAALLNSQPMGFYAPAQIVRDAQEHGVEVRPVDINYSCWDNTLEANTLQAWDDASEAQTLSLPGFGEGGRAKRGRVGFAIAPSPETPPGAQERATLPEAGEGSAYPRDALHLSPEGRGRIAPWRDPGEGEPPGAFHRTEAPSTGMAIRPAEISAKPENNLRPHPEGAALAAVSKEDGLFVQASILRDAVLRTAPQDEVGACAGPAARDSRLNLRHAEMAGDIRATHAVRLGFRQIAGFAEDDGRAIERCRGAGFDSIRDLWLRSSLKPAVLERLATADAFRSLGLDRREALWAVRALRRAGDKDDLPLFAHAAMPAREPDVALPPMRMGEQVVEDYRRLHLSLKAHPVSFLRRELDRRGILPHGKLATTPPGRRVTVAGLVLVRQRPGSANGVIFMTLEDETAVANTIVWPKIFETFRPIVLGARLIAVTGKLQNESGVIHVVADRLDDLSALLKRLAEDTGCVEALAHCDEVRRPIPESRQPPPLVTSRASVEAAHAPADDLAPTEKIRAVMPKGRNFR